jgi:hypothetical protein
MYTATNVAQDARRGRVAIAHPTHQPKEAIATSWVSFEMQEKVGCKRGLAVLSLGGNLVLVGLDLQR